MEMESKNSVRDAFEIPLPDGSSCRCSVRLSLRSRSASLKLSRKNGLELVLPRGYSFKRGYEFALRSAPWIQRTLEKRRQRELSVQNQASPVSAQESPSLPAAIELKAAGEAFPLDCLHSASLGFVSVRIETPGRLLLQGDLQDVAACHEALIGWLRIRALKLFKKRAEEIAAECGLEFESVRVRDQKGRWGSCSRQGRINLNFRLLLLEPRFLRHVLIHELCHTAELNHSPRFWKLVERFEPDAKRTKKELSAAASALPLWLHGDMEL